MDLQSVSILKRGERGKKYKKPAVGKRRKKILGCVLVVLGNEGNYVVEKRVCIIEENEAAGKKPNE
jgi:hypothetical protein